MRGWKVRKAALISGAQGSRSYSTGTQLGSVLLTLSSQKDHRCHHPGVPPWRAHRAARCVISRHSSALEISWR